MRIRKSNVNYIITIDRFSFDRTKFPFRMKYIGSNISMKHIYLEYLEYVYEE